MFARVCEESVCTSEESGLQLLAGLMDENSAVGASGCWHATVLKTRQSAEKQEAASTCSAKQFFPSGVPAKHFYGSVSWRDTVGDF